MQEEGLPSPASGCPYTYTVKNVLWIFEKIVCYTLLKLPVHHILLFTKIITIGYSSKYSTVKLLAVQCSAEQQTGAHILRVQLCNNKKVSLLLPLMVGIFCLNIYIVVSLILQHMPHCPKIVLNLRIKNKTCCQTFWCLGSLCDIIGLCAEI